MHRPLSNALLLAASLFCVGVMQPAFSQARYPDKPIRVLVPFAAGGTTDIVARYVANALSTELGQQVIVDNRPGAGGDVGASMVAKSAPDGYTLLVAPTGTMAINPNLIRKSAFDPRKDVEPVAKLADSVGVVIVGPKVAARSIAELIGIARQKPASLNYSSPGIGTGPHLAGEMLKMAASIDVLHVSYKGGGPAVVAVMTDEVAFMIPNIPSALAQIKGGKVKALAITSRKRSTTLPDVPTMAEAGVPDYEMGEWFGMFAPASTPEPLVRRLNEAVNKVLAKSETREFMHSNGIEPGGGTSASLAAQLDADLGKFARIVKAGNVRVE
jgi:tripartite-type tricarboxylate transporter receptor subunit TctC